MECVLSDHTGDHHELSTYLHHVDGRTVRVALTTSMIPAGGVVAVLRDITKEHDDQAAQQELLVAGSTRNLVIITDERGRIDWVNPAFEEDGLPPRGGAGSPARLVPAGAGDRHGGRGQGPHRDP